MQQPKTASVSDLLKINDYCYEHRKDPNAAVPEIPGFKLLQAQYDTKTGHGGVAFHNSETGVLIVGHRGTHAKIGDLLTSNPLSSEAYNDIRTDAKAVLGAKRTEADQMAINFTEGVIKDLSRRQEKISHIVQTGHSKGGREAQVATCHLAAQGKFDCSAMTFNSLGIHKSQFDPKISYNHVNVQQVGNWPMSADVPSKLYNQIGGNNQIVNPTCKNALTAHTRTTLKESFSVYHAECNKMDALDLIAMHKKGMNMRGIDDYSSAVKQVKEMSSQAVIHDKDSSMSVTQGKVAFANSSYVVQKMGDSNNHYKVHAKKDLADKTLKVGDDVKISYSKSNPGEKAKVESVVQHSRSLKMN